MRMLRATPSAPQGAESSPRYHSEKAADSLYLPWNFLLANAFACIFFAAGFFLLGSADKFSPPSRRIFSARSASATPPHSPTMRPGCLLDRTKNLHPSDRLHFISASFILSQMIAERHTGQQRNSVGRDGASSDVLFFRQTDEQEEELADPWREAEQAHEAGSEAERILPRGRVFGPVRGYVVDKSIAC